jgi:phosphate transport system substrate-binding protein
MKKINPGTQWLKEPARVTIASFALMLSLGVAIEPLGALFKMDAVLAQSAVTDPPATTPSGTLRIDGSTSMEPSNQIRKEQLKQQYPNLEIQTSYNGADKALQSVLDGTADLAAIGRPLTPQEFQQGLVFVPQKRQKIAIVVGSTNPFVSSLSFEQFARIFRGEITNWEQVGGPSRQIRLIDRPATNDTRLAFETYDVFQQAPFVAAPTAAKLTDDRLETMVGQLGDNGISYANADGIADLQGVRIVPMSKVLPLDPRYPFSQPLAYVYKGNPTPAIVAFLGGVPAATAAAPAIAPAPTQTTQTTQTTATEATDATPWLWLLLLPLLGILWWLLKRSPRSAPPIAAVPARPVVVPPPVVPVAPVAPIAAAPVVPVVPAAPANDLIELYEERLVADKTRQKVGDVAINKRIETQPVEVVVPLEKERIILQRMAPKNPDLALGDVAFGVGITRLETFEEVPQIRKEAFVREEVKIAKQIELENATAQATVRHEELDVDIQHPTEIDRSHN